MVLSTQKYEIAYKHLDFETRKTTSCSVNFVCRLYNAVASVINRASVRSFIKTVRYILFDHYGEAEIPPEVIRLIARALLPNIVAYLSTDEGKEEFRKWKEEQEKQAET